MFNNCIQEYSDLVTSHAQTRAGFIEAALEKNRKAEPFINEAKMLKSEASKVENPDDLLKLGSIQKALLTASGLSDKSLKYFEDSDKEMAIQNLIDKFLKPAGVNFVDELVYRFLLIKGDSLGGSMRNFAGAIAKTKLTRTILSALSIAGIPYKVLDKKDKSSNKWYVGEYETDHINAESIAAIYWNLLGKNRILFFDTTIPLVKKNVDICLFEGTDTDFAGGNIVLYPKRALMFGELKGGIDPAGADEHWKTGNTALARIRKAFNEYSIIISTSFVAAAIENNMAKEIWEQLVSGTLSNAANMTDENQLTNYGNWLINL